jgi:hypothetical protein
MRADISTSKPDIGQCLFVSLKLEAAFGNMDNDLSRHAEDNKVMYLSFANIESI